MKKARCNLSVLLYVTFIIGLQPALAQAPTITSLAPLKAHVGSLITIKGSNLANPLTVFFGATQALVVNSSNTVLTVMVMPNSITGGMSVATAFGTASSSQNIFIDTARVPNRQAGNKIYGTNTENTVNPSEQGFSVAISADGNTAVTGGDFDNNHDGAIWVYSHNNNRWLQQGNKLVGTGATGSGAAQGYAVAISADGNTIIEGGIGDNGFMGAAWVFTRDANGVWTQQGNKLVGSGSLITNFTTPEQGYSVSLSADGNTAIIGGRRDNYYIGAAWIFKRNSGAWAEQVKLVGSGYIATKNTQGTIQYHGVQEGSAVSVSADGNTVAVGGVSDNNDTGAVWIFTSSGNTWSQQGNKLTGSGGIRSLSGGIQQGSSVALSADGNTLITGGPFDTDGQSNSSGGGACWIFTRSGNSWQQEGNKLFAIDATLGAGQGWSVSLSADGNTALVGAPTDSSYTGAAWTFTRTNGNWVQDVHKLVGTGAVGAAKQGWSAALSADANTVIIGGPGDYYQSQGASWVFADSANAVLLTQAVKFCPLASSNTLTADLSGTSYQWQVSNGNAFSDLSNNSTYSGTTTNQLVINQLSSSAYGFRYRCRTDGVYGYEFIAKFEDSWTGTSGNTWETAANWSCGEVPDGNTDVIINTGHPAINSNVAVRTLSVSAPAVLTVNTGFNLTIQH